MAEEPLGDRHRNKSQIHQCATAMCTKVGCFLSGHNTHWVQKKICSCSFKSQAHLRKMWALGKDLLGFMVWVSVKQSVRSKISVTKRAEKEVSSILLQQVNNNIWPLVFRKALSWENYLPSPTYSRGSRRWIRNFSEGTNTVVSLPLKWWESCFLGPWMTLTPSSMALKCL